MVTLSFIQNFTLFFHDPSNRELKRKDPYDLRGLEQAIFLLEQLCRGRDRNVIIGQMHGDEQLVSMWTSFLPAQPLD